jgi:acyl-CoA thioester hydrolase
MYLWSMNETQLPEAHIYHPEIRFVDIDAAGIVNNATYLNYFEQSRIQFFESIVGEKWDWNSAGMVIAKHEVNYRQPIFFQDDVTIVTWIERVGNKSMEAAYEIFKMAGEERVLVAFAKTVMVSFDHRKGVSIPWKAELLGPLELFGIGRPSNWASLE